MYDVNGPTIPNRPTIYYSDESTYASSLEARVAWLEGRAAARVSNPYSALVDVFNGIETQVGPPLARRPHSFVRQEVARYVSALETRMYWLEGRDSVKPAERAEAAEQEDTEIDGAAALAGLFGIAAVGLTAFVADRVEARKKANADKAKASKEA